MSATDGSRISGPIAGADVTVVDGVNRNARVKSDATGRFSFADLESGRLTISIAASGYTSITPVIDLYRDLDASFALKRR